MTFLLLYPCLGAEVLATVVSYNSSSCWWPYFHGPSLISFGNTLCSLCALKPTSHNDFPLLLVPSTLISLFLPLTFVNLLFIKLSLNSS